MLVVVARIRSGFDGFAGTAALVAAGAAVGAALGTDVAAVVAFVGAGAATVGAAGGFVEAAVGLGAAAGTQPNKAAKARMQINARMLLLNSVLLKCK